MLVGPVTYHRLVFRQHLKKPPILVANKMAIAGLTAVVFIACLFAVLWFVLPLVRRQRADSDR